jgi:hypothetical protein
VSEVQSFLLGVLEKTWFSILVVVSEAVHLEAAFPQSGSHNYSPSEKV